MSLANFSASLSLLPPNLRSSRTWPRPNWLVSCCLSDEYPNQTDAGPPPSPMPKSKRASHQLNRWSRARTIRSGRRLDWPGLRTKTNQTSLSPTPPSTSSSPPPLGSTLTGEISPSVSVAEESDEDDGNMTVTAAEGKAIYMVSDGTGWTAEYSVNAALGQFEHCLINRACAVNTHLFSGVEDTERLMEIIKQAAREGALLLYTLVDPSMAEAAKKACQLSGVPSTDILRPTTEAIAAHLGVAPSGIPRGCRRAPLTEEYFKRIEAIEFTIKQDDGALPCNLSSATIVLVGVSRSGKTPLSIYLAQKGYKVANIPIVMGVELPKKLFEIDQEKVFGLTINPVALQTIRKARAKSLGLGFGNDVRSNYSEMDHVREELEHANKIFAQNLVWPVIEVTGKAIEETAAVVVRIYHDRKNKCLLPRISKRY